MFRKDSVLLNTMESEDDRWYAAFAMSAVQNKMFFVIIEKGISAMIENGRNLKLGNFYEVKFAHNSAARPENRAQHLVTQYRAIAPLAEAVVTTDDLGRQHVTVTTTARCIGTVNAKGRQCAKLYNDTFGNFIDLSNIVRERNKMVKFEFKCAASPAHKYSSIFLPTRILNYYDIPEEDMNLHQNLIEIVGLICSEQNGSIYLWSKQLDREAHVDERNWPEGSNMTGYWVKATVDKTRDLVVGSVEEVMDIFKVETMGGVTELLVTFRNLGFSDDKNCRTFQHADFPCIFDTRNKVQFTADDVVYTGWLQHQRVRGNNGFWFVSHQQPMVTPQDNYERPESRASNRSFQPRSDSMNGDSQRWNNDPNHHGSQNFEPRQQGANSSNSVRERVRTSSRVQTTTDEESEHEEDTRREVTSALSDVVPGRRRSNANSRGIDSGSESDDDRVTSHSNRNSSRAPVNGNGTNINYVTPTSPDRALFQTSTGVSDNAEKLKQENNQLQLLVKKNAAAMKYLLNGDLVVAELKFYDENLHETLKSLHSQLASFAPWSQNPNQSAVATEEENRILARRLQNLANAVSTWLDDQLIRNAMRDYDPSQYEELLRIIRLQNQDTPQALNQERDALKMQLSHCALLVEYFTEDAEVSKVMIEYNRTKYEELRKRVKDIYTSL